MNKKINNDKKEENNIFMNGLNFIGCNMNGALFQTIITENKAETEEPTFEDNSSEEEYKAYPNDQPLALSNLIFNPRFFPTEDSYRRLYETILSFISQGEAEIESENQINASFQINPEIQAEWYYIMKAIGEAKITGSRKLTDTNFLRQMRIWFPSFFLTKEDEDEKKLIRRYALSLSAERKKWQEGSEEQEVTIQNMLAHSQNRGYNRLKTIRLYNIAEGLKKQLKLIK